MVHRKLHWPVRIALDAKWAVYRSIVFLPIVDHLPTYTTPKCLPTNSPFTKSCAMSQELYGDLFHVRFQLMKFYCAMMMFRFLERSTVDSRYYDTDGIRKMYQYIQTIDITSLNFYCLGMVGIQIRFGIVITSISL